MLNLVRNVENERSIMNNKNKFGNKAESLKLLLEEGYNVPKAIFIEFEENELFLEDNSHLKDFFKGEETQKIIVEKAIFSKNVFDKISQFILEFPSNSFAVRSSGSMEDLNDTSFAGMYSTFLNLTDIESIILAVKYCWLSVYNDRVIEYCTLNNHDVEKMKMGIIIQHMISTDVAGVSFSINPVSGNDKEVLIEACYGLGEGLVSGELSPDCYYYNWFNGEITNKAVSDKTNMITSSDTWPFTQKVDVPSFLVKEQALSDQQIEQLANVVVDIQKLYGMPMDVEWGIKNNELFIFQARPITTISYNAYSEEWTTADFKDGGVSSKVCTQFMWSAYKMIWENALPDYLISIAFLKKNEGIEWGEMFFGRPYWNLSIVKQCLARIPGYCERKFDEDFGIEVTYEGDGLKTGFNLKTIIHGIRVLGKLEKSFNQCLSNTKSFNIDQQTKIERLDQLDIKGMEDIDFFRFYESFLIEDYFYNESNYFKLIFDNSNCNTLFKDFLNKSKVDVNFLNLIIGLKNVSHIRPAQALWELSNIIKSNTKGYIYWLNSTKEEILNHYNMGKVDYNMDLFREYIYKYKHHSTHELDITVERYDESPVFVIDNLKNLLISKDVQSPEEANEEQYKIYSKEIDKIRGLTSRWKSKKILQKINQLRDFLWWREEYRDLSTKYYYFVRKFTLNIAERWIAKGILVNTNDIFFYSLQDIIAVNNGTLSTSEAQLIFRRNKRYYYSFRNYNNPSEIGSRFQENASVKKTGLKSQLKGVPCSIGKVTGTARVIKDIYDVDRIREGDILVTKFTDPGWTLKFRLLSGVITENGGVLSHAAVISREFGIPAILSVKNAMIEIKDGDMITMNGGNGEILLHQ